MKTVEHELEVLGHTFNLLDHDGSHTLEVTATEFLNDGIMKAMTRVPQDYDGFLVDIGANIGMWSVFWSLHYPKAKIVAVEAMEDNALLCRENLRRNNPNGHWQVIQVAIGPVGVDFVEMTKHPANPGGASAVHDQGGTPYRVDAWTLKRLFEEAKIDRCGMMKVDIEGMEFTALLQSTSTCKKIEHLYVELHTLPWLPQYLNEAVFKRFKDELKNWMPGKNRVHCLW